MTVMWSHSSFCNYTMKLLNKYLEGTIYMNFFLDGIASLFAIIVADKLYTYQRMKTTYLVSISLVVSMALIIAAFQ